MKHVLVLALALVAGACATTSSPEQDFTLSAGRTMPAVASLPRVAVAVGAAHVAEMYDRPQFVVRASENRVRILEQARWAEPLKSGIPRVVAADIGRALGTSRTTAYPAAESSDTGYRVSLDVQRFDATVGEGAAVEVSWRIHRLPDGPVRAGRTEARESASGDYEALVAAQSRALATVSRDIARAIASLERG